MIKIFEEFEFKNPFKKKIVIYEIEPIFFNIYFRI